MRTELAAAFGRLCVETLNGKLNANEIMEAAAFGRLCVETVRRKTKRRASQAAAFGRLCVETFAAHLK